MNNATLKQITALPSMTSTELRALWKELGMGDSLHFNKPYLIKRIAYRLQELALGGESIAYIRRMEALVRSCSSPHHWHQANQGKKWTPLFGQFSSVAKV